ncbi:hypothetical protein E8E14_005282 [Neopestalotiopsis sp. 37M]|nr:hypothetical protein E8E14_005282 [Neopestalotiopsis sp. 37M]
MSRVAIVNALVNFLNAEPSSNAAPLEFVHILLASMSSPSPSLRRAAESPSPLELRTGRSFKRRFDINAVTDEQEHGKSPKRRATNKYRLFNPFEPQRQRHHVPIPGKRLFVDRVAQKQQQQQQQQQQNLPRPSTPEPPLMVGINDSYRKYQMAKYSEVLTELEATQEQVTEEALSQTNTGQLAMKKFVDTHASILDSVMDVKTTLSVSSPNGTQRQKDVLISDILKAEILVSLNEVDGSAVAPPVGDVDSEHAAAIAELEEEVDNMGRKTMSEYKKYESLTKEKSISSKINIVVGQLVQSMLQTQLA